MGYTSVRLKKNGPCEKRVDPAARSGTVVDLALRKDDRAAQVGPPRLVGRGRA
jgi:hypothetical protein